MLWRSTRIGSRRVIVDNLRVRSAHEEVVLGLGRLSSLGRPRPLLTGRICFRKALLASFGLPIVVPDPATIFDDAASELPKHGPGRDDGNLSRAVRKGQDLLLHEVVLFLLAGNDFVQRPVLVEEQVGVTVA